MAQPRVGVGDRLAGYVIDSVLGEGGMGIVFRAYSEGDGSVVALKVLKRALADDAVYRRRFLHEVRAARQVRHRHLIAVLDAGEDSGWSYLAMPYMPGGSLAARLRAGPLALHDLLRVGAEVASGIDVLHEKGIIHRDIKPSNILFDGEGRAVLTDFGLAKGRAYTLLTKQGHILGSTHYLAPELVRGQAATVASDIYAFGCSIFECVAGAPPFARKSFFEIGVAHLQDEPSDPSANRSDLSPQFSWAVLQALSKDPTRRPSSATLYAHMLRLGAPRRQ